jgi:release factor glutamine methyltransferase
MTVQTALSQGASLLEKGAIAVPRLTAEVLLAYALRCERIYLYAHPEQELKQVEWLHYGRYLHERLQGKPTQYITKHQEFYGREFAVSPDVLIPRPETEHVVEAALQIAGSFASSAGKKEEPRHPWSGASLPAPSRQPSNARPFRILDVGTGSGAIAATLQLELGAEAWASDCSHAAAKMASGNAKRLGAKVSVVVCDLMEAIASHSVDLIVSNPPYVPAAHKEGLQREVRDWEPHLALFAGDTGFELYDRIVASAPRVLRPGGWIALELGFGANDHVAALLSNWKDLRIEPDLAGIPRVAAAHI